MQIRILSLLIIISLFSGCISIKNHEQTTNLDDLDGYLSLYYVRLDLINIDYFTLFLPYPEEWDTIDDYNMKGNNNISLIDTKYGKVLYIDGNENFTFVSNRISESEPLTNLSLIDTNDNITSIMCNYIPCTGKINISWIYQYKLIRGAGIQIDFDSDLVNGYQEIHINYKQILLTP
ncbi:MAG: hypothetical protein QCI82_09260 [Candidatus Thermoplasmatota archaeon]|nr:hypothetical protein [Candidatus Thermoplasmatota archaeon]